MTPAIFLVWVFFVFGNAVAKEIPSSVKSKKTALIPAPINFDGVIGGDEVSNGPYDPGLITNTSSATGTSGTIQYRWQSSTDGITWTNILSGTTQNTYDPGPITQTTYYRRLSRNASSGSYEGASNIVTKAITNYSINTPVGNTAGSTLNLTQTGNFPLFHINENNNWDFTAGNSNFSSDVPSNYWVATNTSSVSGADYNFAGYWGAGRMMTIQSPTTANQDIWFVNVNVVAGNTYDLSAFVRSISSTNLSVLRWFVGTTALGSSLTAPIGSWQELATTYTATSTGTVSFAIRNSNIVGTDNDFALDYVNIIEHTPVTYLWTGPNGFTSTLANPTIPNAQIVNSGVYTLTVTRNGYSITISKTIMVDANPAACLPPSLSLTRTNVSCFGESNGSITAVGTLGNGGLGNLNYQIWEGIAGTSVSNLTSNANYPNSPNSSITTSSAQAPSNFLDNYGSRMVGYIVPRETGTYYFWISSDDNSELWLGTSSNPTSRILRASVTGWTDPIQWDKYTSQKSVAISLTAGQIYYIEILHKEGTGGDNLAVGWSKPGQSSLAPSEILPSSVLRPLDPSSLTIPVYTYSVNGGAFQSSGAFSNLPAGNYTVTLQDSYGCTATSSISVTEPSAITSSATSNSPVCSGSTLTLTGGSVSGGSYDWTGPNSYFDNSRVDNISNVSANAAGIYTLTVQVGSCSATYTTAVTIIQSPIVARSITNPTCGFNNGSITFTITDDPAQTQVSLSIDGGTTFPYTINDNVGTYTISNLGAGTYGLRARWVTGTVCPVNITSATLTTTTQLLGLTMSPNPTTCAGTSVTISGSTTQGVSPYTYAWTPNDASDNLTPNNVFNPVANPSVTRTYMLTVTDAAGCTATGNVTVNVVSSPGVVISSPDSLICVNGSSTISSTIDVAGTYNYQWQTSPNGTTGWTNIFGATSPNYTNSFLSIGSYFYRVIVTGSSGACTPGVSSAFKIRVVSTPTASVVAARDTTCLGTPSILKASVSNGAGSITYQWQQSANGSTGWYDLPGQVVDSLSPAFSPAGRYYYRVIAYMTGIGCSYAVSPTYTFTVHNPGTITVNPPSTLVCVGGSSPLSTTVVGVSGSYSYQWQGSPNNSTWTSISGATGSSYSPTNDTVGVKYFRIVVNFGSCGLQTLNSVQIQTNDRHEVVASITNQPVCVNGSTQLLGTLNNPSGSVSYQWQSRVSTFGSWNNVSGATSINYTPPTSTQGTIYYRLNVSTTPNGCGTVSSDDITLNIVPQTTVSISPSSAIICQNGVYTLNSTINNGVGPFTYQWQMSTTGVAGSFSNISGETNSTYTPITSTLNTRYYKVIVNASGNGCIPAESNVLTITVLPRPTVNVTNTGIHCVGSVFKLTATPNPATPTPITAYAWSSTNGFASSQQSPLVLASSGAMGGVYTVTVTGANLCTNTNTTSMTIQTNCGSICNGQYIIIPTNPGTCAGTNGYVRVTAATTYETSLDGVAWVRGRNNQSPNYTDFTNLGTGNYLFFVRDFASQVVCKNVNITLVSDNDATPLFTVNTITGANGCYATNGSIRLNGLQPTDQVSWMATLNTTYVAASSLTSGHTISGLAPGTYYVKVTRNGQYCYSDQYITVPNIGTACAAATLCDDSLIPNLFPNGDFGSGAPENGPVYIETQYGYSNYTCFAPWDGFYSITNNTDCDGNGTNAFSNQASGWWDVLYEDHTVGDVNGYMMVVNAGYTPNIVTEKVIGNLCPNTQYNFTAWLKNISPTSDIQPNVSFIIDGIIRAQSGDVTGGSWQRFGFSFKTGASTTSALFAIRNVAPGGFGNNFIIDDIKVSKCPLDIQLDGESIACLGGTNETINASITDPNREHDYYKWQESNDNGATWQDVTGVLQGTFVGNTMNVTINLPTPIVSALSGKLYRIKLATTASTVDDPICSVTSTISKVIVPPVAVSVTPPVTICNGASASLTAVGSGGTSPYTYTWTNTAATGGTVSVSPTTTTNYTVTARDVDNCSATATTQVIVTPLPVASATAQTICTGTAFSVTPTTNIVGTQYRWTVAQISGTSTGHTNQATSVNGPISQTLTNNTAVDAVVRYTVTPYNGTCAGANFTFDVTVRPTIVITNPGNQTICSGTAFSRTPTSNIAGTTYTWTAAITSAPTSGTITGFTNNTIASAAPITQTLTNTGTTSGVVTYTVTPVANGCNGTPFTFEITVQPAIIITNPGPQTICSGTAFSRTPTSNISGTIYTWTAAITTAPTSGTITGFANNAVASAAPISQTLTNSGTTNGVVTYTVTPVANGCNGTPFTIAITVQPTIVITNPGPQTICSGTAFSRTPISNIAGTTYTWTAAITTAPTSGTITGFTNNAVASAAPISQTLTNTGTTNGVVTYTVTPVTAGCNGTPFTFEITVQPTIVITNPGNQAICSGTAFSRTPTSNIAGTTYTWTVAVTTAPTAGAITGHSNNSTASAAPISQTLTNSGSTNGVVTYTLTPVANGCNGTPFTFDITVYPTIVITNPGPQTICSGTAFSRTPLSNIAGTTYTWTAAITSAPTSGTITGFTDNAVASVAPISQTLTNTGTTNGVVTYTVTPVANGCNGTPFTFGITVQPTIVITNPGPQTICSGTAFSRTPTSNITGTTYTWTAAITSAPTFGTITGFTNNALASAAPISQTLTNTGTTNGVVTYTVTPVANGCNGTPFTFDVTVYPTVTMNDPADLTACNGSTVAPAAFTSTFAGVTYTWTNSNTAIGLAANGTGDIASFTATNTGTTPITATITVTPTGNGCPGTTQTFTIIVYPTVTMNDPADLTACNGGTVAPAAFTSTFTGVTYTWTNSNTAIGLAANGTGDIASFTATNTGTTPITATITVTPTGNGCPGTAQTFTIIVYPTVTMNDPADLTACNGSTIAPAAFTSTFAGVTYTWTNSNTAIGLAANGTGDIASFTATNTGTTPITATITVTPTGNGCPGTPQTFTIIVYPTVTMNDPVDLTACNGSTVAPVAFTSTFAGVTYTWTNSNTAIGLAASGTGDIASFTATNTGTTPITATITVTPTGNGCPGTAQTFTIIVYPTVTMNDPADLTACNGSTVAPAAFTS
ncbi:MAG TPA: PKD-like domain-containing protein, partial [Leadbetterella sp.]|nr:PKD-like domain-containing protein [Leadbetterella sp.]